MKRSIRSLFVLFLMANCTAPTQSPTIAPKPSLTPTYSPSPTCLPTDTPTPTTTPTPSYTLSGIVFFDYNGNGLQDHNEPLLEGIIIEVLELSATTDANGNFSLGGIPEGSIRVKVLSTEFEYILPSDCEALSIKEGVSIDIDKDTKIHIALAQGTHVLPVPAGYDYWIGTWFDRDKRIGYVENWQGQKGQAYTYPHTDVLYNYEVRVTDQHFAIDYIFPVITPILATDAGKINNIYKDIRQTNPNDYIVGIITTSGLTLDYGHVRPIDGLEVGQEVCRGQIIGYSVSGWWPPPFDIEYAYIVHVGFAPSGSRSYSDSIDPYPDLWTTPDYELARLEYIDANQ